MSWSVDDLKCVNCKKYPCPSLHAFRAMIDIVNAFHTKWQGSLKALVGGWTESDGLGVINIKCLNYYDTADGGNLRVVAE